MQPQEQPVVKIGQLEIRYLVDGTVTGGPSLARMVEVMNRYGLVLAPPKPPTAAP